MRLIDADALSKRLGELWDIPADWDGDMDETCQEAFTEIDNAPTIEAEPVRKGKWKFNAFIANPFCSQCGRELFRKYNERLPNFCPYCNAEMDGKENEA